MSNVTCTADGCPCQTGGSYTTRVTGWTTLGSVDPKCGPAQHEYHWSLVGRGKDAVTILYCSKCADIRKVEVPE